MSVKVADKDGGGKNNLCKLLPYGISQLWL